MAKPNLKLFLSCVSDEFGTQREALRHELTGLTVEVKVQEDFISLGLDTLMKLDAYVRNCDVIVHLVGDMAGSSPPPPCVTGLIGFRRDLKFNVLGPLIDSGEKIPYTQWEAWLAIYHGRPLVIAVPETTCVRGPNFEPTPESKALQVAHLNRLRQLGRHAEVQFANREQLVIGIFKSLFALFPNVIHPTSGGVQRLTPQPIAYVERNALLEQIVSRMGETFSSYAPAAIVLRGPRGCGKSTLADDLCDRVSSKVHRISEGKELDSTVADGDLVLVDGLLDTMPWEQAVRWIRGLNANYLIVTSRRPDAAHAIQTAHNKTYVTEVDIGGFTHGEFVEAINICRSNPQCALVELDSRQIDILFENTGGLPLAIRLLLEIAGSPTFKRESLVFLSAMSPTEMLDCLLREWQLEVIEKDDQLRTIVVVLSNVPSVGMSNDAIAFVLDWEIAKVDRYLSKLWYQGFLAQLTTKDRAVRLIDAIRGIFKDIDSDSDFIQAMRNKYCHYCETYVPSKSIISMTDSMLLRSKYMFGHIERELFPWVAKVRTYSVILELEKLQKTLIGDSHSDLEWRSKVLATWIANHIEDNFQSMACNEVIALSGLALKLPICSHDLASAFCLFWETKTGADATIVSSAIVASAYHWRDQVGSNKHSYLSRLQNAVDLQNWANFGSLSDVVAAGFGAAYAIMDASIIGAGIMTGYRIRGIGISPSEAFAVMLLLHDTKAQVSAANSFVQNNSSYCLDIDPVTAVYLTSRGIICSSQQFGGKIKANLNRVALLALWSQNESFRKFIERILEIADRISDDPPIFEFSREAMRSALSST
jgi:hypothetical protein